MAAVTLSRLVYDVSKSWNCPGLLNPPASKKNFFYSLAVHYNADCNEKYSMNVQNVSSDYDRYDDVINDRNNLVCDVGTSWMLMAIVRFCWCWC